MQSTMMNYPLTLDHILERAGTFFSDVQIVSNMPDKRLHRHTYSDFHQRAKALAEMLIRAGIRPGDRVATLMWNHYAHLEAYFGVPAAGAVLHTLNLRLAPDDLAYIVNHAEDQILIVDDVLLPLLARIEDKVQFKHIWVVPLSGKPVPEPFEDYEGILAQARGDFVYPEKDENDPCGMCYTSGTTGRPKGVVYSHRSTVLHSLASALPDSVGISFNDVAVPVVPMFHANAWGFPYSCTMVGSQLVFPGPHLDAESLLNLYESEKVTLTAGVPTIWMGILQALDANPDRWKLANMRMVVGGSAVPESMIRRFDRFGLNVIQGWGMTETSPLAAISRLKPAQASQSDDERYAYRATQGLPCPFVEFRITDEWDQAQAWDGKAVGEIQVRGPWITGAYYRLDKDTASDKFAADGWLRTGDVAVVDPGGYIKITDRTKDLIKSGGEWISSVELENAIMGHPDVAEAAVIAVAHSKWGERPLAVVVRKAQSELTHEQLAEFLQSKLPKWMCPEGYVFESEIPRTSTGKFNKLALRQGFKDWRWDSE